MAYRRNGNCAKIMRLSGAFGFTESELMITGRVRVNRKWRKLVVFAFVRLQQMIKVSFVAIVLVRCLFGTPTCDDGFGTTATHKGWNRVNISPYILGKVEWLVED